MVEWVLKNEFAPTILPREALASGMGRCPVSFSSGIAAVRCRRNAWTEFQPSRTWAFVWAASVDTAPWSQSWLQGITVTGRR